MRVMRCFLFAAAFACAAFAQRQPSTLERDQGVVIPVQPSWARVPTDQATVQPATEEEKDVRDARSNSFNNTLGPSVKLEDLHRANMGVGGAPDRGYLPPLPVSSSVIIVGKVLSAASYLSSDHTAIYTELRVQVEQILKDSRSATTLGFPIDILERGGSVKFQDQVLQYPVAVNSDLIDVGNRYLLFLSPKADALKAFGVVRAWLLNNGHPQPAGAFRATDQENASRYMAMNEAEFTAYIEHAVQSGNTH